MNRYASSHRSVGGGQAGSNNNAIGVNEDMFLQAFDSTPKLEIGTQKKLETEFSRVVTIISNPHADWDNRVQAMKHFRSLVNSGIAETEHFYTTTLKSLEIPFQNNICDLRSQVVRETCITLAFLSLRLQQKFCRTAEILLPSLIKLIPNSAKIVSTSAIQALRFIIQSSHNSKFITIIKYQLSTSKSKEIHRALCEILERIVTLWGPHILERQINDLQEALRLGICNSDESARQFARRAFNAFAEHFREPADRLFNSLDPQRQRQLNNLNHGGGSTLSMNGYGATTTLNTIGHTSSGIPMASSNNHCSVQSNFGPSSINIVSRLKNSITTSNNGVASGVKGTMTTASPSRIRTPTARSTSAIDVNAQRRAKARAVYLSSMYTKPRQPGTIGSPIKPVPAPLVPTGNSYTPNSMAHPTVVHTNNQSSAVFQQHQVNHLNHHGQYLNNHNASTTPSQQTHHLNSSSGSSINNNNITPNVAQQQQQLRQLQQQQAASAEKRDGVALSKAAAYLMSVINNKTIAETQIVTTIKYFNSLIEKHPVEIVSQFLPEIMPPLVIGLDNLAICIRKASVFAMVAIHAKVGLEQMESYLTSLTMTQRKLLEVYIKKSKDESKSRQSGVAEVHDSSKRSSSTSMMINSSSTQQVSSTNLI